MSREVLGLGVIGMGRIGFLHARCIQEQVQGARLVHAVDPFLSEQARTWLASQPGVAVGLDAAELLANPAVEAVLICSATDTHAPLIEAAAKAGKHIFCEKPVDLSPARIRQVLAVVEHAGVQFQTGFNRRFDTHFAEIKRGIDAGAIGAPQLLRICSRDPSPPPAEYVKVSGGLFLDMMIHDFDMARFLFGEVVQVEAQGAVLVDPRIGELGDVDTAIATLRFANGALGVIDNSRRAVYGYDQRIEVFGSAGMLACDNSYPHSVKLFNADGISGAKPLHFFLERYRDTYVREIEAFVAALRGEKPLSVSGYDGLRAVEIGVQARDSCRQRNSVSV